MIYLIHIEPAFKHARHYIGFTSRDDVNLRLNEHKNGTGSIMLRHAVRAGCELILANTWQGDRTAERRMKKQKNSKRFCPICKGRVNHADNRDYTKR